MMAGHFGLAAALKAREPRVPLWSLMLATQWLDLLFVPLYLVGVETLDPSGGPGHVITRSLAGALLLAAVAGWLAGRASGRRAGWVIGTTVFSHWALDLVVHLPDLPLLPGNLGGLPLLGFGLWRRQAASIVAEAALILVGSTLYFRSALARARAIGAGPGRAIPCADTSAGVSCTSPKASSRPSTKLATGPPKK